MFVRKTQIGTLVRKEKEKERKQCEKQSREEIKKLRQELEQSYQREIRELKAYYRKELDSRQEENRRLRREIDSQYSLYQDIRRREQQMDDLSAEFEDVLTTMTVRMQEAMQPFYRTRSKIEMERKKSEKSHEKVENLFVAARR